MHIDIAQERRRTHAYVDQLSGDQLHALRFLLEAIIKPASRSMATAPDEDEEIGTDEEDAATEAREWLQHNKPIPMEKVLSDFGLTMADFERMGEIPIPGAR